ncbi:hypothetical protein K3495_g2336 [Podosphaera aphanis]|nr:hypothetical protein K3495_g2336 [Podosphaera aphanis]
MHYSIPLSPHEPEASGPARQILGRILSPAVQGTGSSHALTQTIRAVITATALAGTYRGSPPPFQQPKGKDGVSLWGGNQSDPLYKLSKTRAHFASPQESNIPPKFCQKTSRAKLPQVSPPLRKKLATSDVNQRICLLLSA